MTNRVLVFTPTYNDLLQPATVASVEAMRFDGVLDHIISDENPYPGRDMRNCVHQFSKGRQLAIDGGYDALLLIEHDMIVPDHAAQTLFDTPAPVVYGSYQLRHQMNCVNLFQLTGGRNIGMSLSLYPRELKIGQDRGWLEVSGAGFGCLLIRGEILRQIPFRDTGNAPDLPFAQDCLRAGITQIGRTDVSCGHIDTDHNLTLWPFEKGVYGTIARVRALQDVTTQDNGQTIAMKKGRYYSFSVQAARELQRAGYVEISNDADTVTDEMQARETAEAPTARETAVSPKTRRKSK